MWVILAERADIHCEIGSGRSAGSSPPAASPLRNPPLVIHGPILSRLRVIAGEAPCFAEYMASEPVLALVREFLECEPEDLLLPDADCILFVNVPGRDRTQAWHRDMRWAGAHPSTSACQSAPAQRMSKRTRQSALTSSLVCLSRYKPTVSKSGTFCSLFALCSLLRRGRRLHRGGAAHAMG